MTQHIVIGRPRRIRQEPHVCRWHAIAGCAPRKRCRCGRVLRVVDSLKDL